MTRDELPPFLKTREVCAFLGVSDQFLKEARRKGTGPKFTRISQDCIRYERKALLEWIDARSFASDAEAA